MSSMRCEVPKDAQANSDQHPERTKSSVVALVDCNNFYASCERLFQPGLEGKPIVVLSNNDGCIIARSNEAKVLGLKMGDPLFKVRHYLDKAGVRFHSSNYALYGDLSSRVMRTLAEFTPELEVYSIDEAFLNLSGMVRSMGDLVPYAQRIRGTVKQWTGIPVSVGIAETKTLAKLANRMAKHTQHLNGVLDICEMKNREALLESVDVGDVWGIGSRYAKRLRLRGIKTARQLRDADERWIQKEMKMGIVGVRLVMELRGIPCLPLDLCPASKKGIGCSRSFGIPVTLLQDLKEATAMYVSRAAEKLRAQHSLAGVLSVYLMTNPFKTEPQYYNSATVEFPAPTANTTEMITHALRALERIYRPGFRYKKTGILLDNFSPDSAVQLSFFDSRDPMKGRQLMQVMDRVNRCMGADTLFSGALGVKRPWAMRREFRSPASSTSWQELAVVRADFVEVKGVCSSSVHSCGGQWPGRIAPADNSWFQ